MGNIANNAGEKIYKLNFTQINLVQVFIVFACNSPTFIQLFH